MEYKEIAQLVDDQAKCLVGQLCKKVECLEGVDALNPRVYKAIAKETVYENFRFLKKLIYVCSEFGEIKFEGS